MLTKQNARRAAWLVGIAAIALVLCSKSSPLYVLNDWMDANIFFTMGKSMFRGKVLYRDVFDHKGPVLYFLYGLASLIDYTGFTGVLVVEIIAFAFFFALRSAHSGTAGRAGTAPGLGRAARGGHCRQPGLCPRRQRRAIRPAGAHAAGTGPHYPAVLPGGPSGDGLGHSGAGV